MPPGGMSATPSLSAAVRAACRSAARVRELRGLDAQDRPLPEGERPEMLADANFQGTSSYFIQAAQSLNLGALEALLAAQLASLSQNCGRFEVVEPPWPKSYNYGLEEAWQKVLKALWPTVKSAIVANDWVPEADRELHVSWA